MTSAEVETAIQKVLATGQAYRLTDGTEVTRANLQTMIDLRTRLQGEEQQASSGQGIFAPIQFRRAT